MTADDLVGQVLTLPIRRFGPPGAFLAVDRKQDAPDAPVVLLLGPEIPEDAREGDELDVFVYHDSEGRPLATRQMPRLELGQVAHLVATDCNRFGAFFDWGLPKELLVPFAKQTADVHVGARYAVGLERDRDGRLVGTMRVSELLEDTADFREGEWVEGEAWRRDPAIGLFVIVEREFVGLLPAHEPHNLSRGDAARFRVARVLPDGRIELSLRAPVHEQIDADAEAILKVLGRPGAPRVGDASSPEQLRVAFGLSRKAFKRAVGRLLKTGRASLDPEGFVVPRPGRR
jgi:predicted RNA-binding protein (virulence factor B family)